MWQEAAPWEQLVGPVTGRREPQALFADEDLEHALRQLVLFGRDGLPVLSHDGEHPARLDHAQRRAQGARTAHRARLEARSSAARSPPSSRVEDPSAEVHEPPTPLRGYEIVELAVDETRPHAAAGSSEIRWPHGCRVVAVIEGRKTHAASGEMRLRAGDHVILLVPAREPEPAQQQRRALTS